MTDVFPLPDGRYDVLVVDATADDDALAIEITILAGAHKGEVVGVRATGVKLDELDLLGLPAALWRHLETSAR